MTGEILAECRGAGVVAGLLCTLIFLVALPREARGADNGSGQAVSQPQPVASPAASANSAAANRSAANAAGGQQDFISSNPAANELLPGTGQLGRLIGLDASWGITLGGVWVGNSDYLFTGGAKPRSWSFNSLLIVNLNLDLEKMVGLPGSSINASMLQFNGQPANSNAGAVTGYDGLTGPDPLQRTQLYQLWWRQVLFSDRLIIRVGKQIPTVDFNNVSRANVISDKTLEIPTVTALIYTPIFVNPTVLGALPGYYNSAYGTYAHFAVTDDFTLAYGFYDGALASGVQTGLDAAPVFNGHYFTIGEADYAWLLGQQEKPGRFGAGGWAQTGTLSAPGVTQNGAQGLYAFGSQRLWDLRSGVDNSGISAFFQFGFNDSNTMLANRYFGLGTTGFGLVPERPEDSMGAGLAWSWLNRKYGFRSNEAMLQAYYQVHLIGPAFFEPVISYIPNPGASPQIQGAVTMTAQLTILL